MRLAAAAFLTVLAAHGDLARTAEAVYGGTVLLHDTDRTAAPGCWRSALGALSGLVGECRAAGWTVGRLAEHWSGGEQATPFIPEFMPNGARVSRGDLSRPPA